MAVRVLSGVKTDAQRQSRWAGRLEDHARGVEPHELEFVGHESELVRVMHAIH